MPSPIELCIECKDNPFDDRFYKCTARTGREAGLSIQEDGTVGWCEKNGAAVDLWVGDDGRLLVHRAKQTDEAFVTRRGRKLLLPETKVALLKNKDELTVRGRTFVIHVHGTAADVHPPRPVRVLRAAALAAALSATAPACIEGTRQNAPANTDTSPPITRDTDTAAPADSDTMALDNDAGGDVTDTAADSDTMVLDNDAGDDAGDVEIIDTPPIVLK